MSKTKGLIIKSKWADLILSGRKTIEIRGSRTNIRGKIGVIKSGTKKIYGTVELYGCKKITEENFKKWRDKHKLEMSYEELVEIYSNPYAWFMKNQIKFSIPKPYEHRRGCVIWVNIEYL